MLFKPYTTKTYFSTTCTPGFYVIEMLFDLQIKSMHFTVVVRDPIILSRCLYSVHYVLLPILTASRDFTDIHNCTATSQQS